jgi:hypothetical protein
VVPAAAAAAARRPVAVTWWAAQAEGHGLCGYLESRHAQCLHGRAHVPQCRAHTCPSATGKPMCTAQALPPWACKVCPVNKRSLKT